MIKKILLVVNIAVLALTGCNYSEGGKPKNNVSAGYKKNWNYGTNNGPTHWKEFSSTCGKGIHQSPVNIIPGKTLKMNHAYDLTMHDDITGLAKVIDNGHSIKVTPEHGGHIKLHGEIFDLLQYHFHGKSEHTIDGKRFAMVAHMVHQNPKTKQLAVVAVFFEEGAKNKVLEKIINHVGSTVQLDAQDFVPLQTEHYYHYIGSLTTPPCSENVQWYLLKQPQEASEEQIKHFRKFYVDNERPVQELHDRFIEVN